MRRYCGAVMGYRVWGFVIGPTKWGGLKMHSHQMGHESAVTEPSIFSTNAGFK